MPVLNIKLDNILCFHDFELNLSYPQKLQSSLVKEEHLKSIPSFRYKKINIFIGSNASGKTSLIRCIWNILYFIKRKEKIIILDMVHDKNKEASIEMDFVDNNNRLLRLKLKTAPFQNDDSPLKIAFCSLPLKKRSSYEALKKQLDAMEYEYRDHTEIIHKLFMTFGYLVVLPATETIFDKIRCLDLDENEEVDFIEILNRVLHTLDPSIVKVSKSKDADKAYVIHHDEIGKIILQEGMSLIDLDKLSSGTKYGFNIAKIIFSIKNQKNGIYLIDEQFSYVNSDIEKAFISLMVSLLGADEQIFITTHNPDVLEMGLPFHSYNFMKKEKINEMNRVISYCASQIENRNNVSVRSLLDNDVFNTCPNVNDILELGESNE